MVHGDVFLFQQYGHYRLLGWKIHVQVTFLMPVDILAQQVLRISFVSILPQLLREQSVLQLVLVVFPWFLEEFLLKEFLHSFQAEIVS